MLVSSLVKALKDAGPNSYLMINAGQMTYLRMDVGYSDTWQPRLLQNLDQRPELKKVYVNADATVYALKKQSEGTCRRPIRV